MTSYYTQLKKKLGIGQQDNNESDSDDRVMNQKGFRTFMKKRRNKYFKMKNREYFNKVKNKKQVPLNMRTLENFNIKIQALDIEQNPYVQITPQKIKDAAPKRSSRISKRSVSKRISAIKGDEERFSSSMHSRLFDRSSSHLEKYRNIILESEKNSTKRTSVKKEKGRGKSAYNRRKIFQPPVKTYELPTENPFFNRTMLDSENQKLLNRTFDWKKVGNMKHVQDRIKKRIKYLVHVDKDSTQGSTKITLNGKKGKII